MNQLKYKPQGSLESWRFKRFHRFHPAIIFHLARVGAQWQQAKQEEPVIPLLSDTF